MIMLPNEPTVKVSKYKYVNINGYSIPLDAYALIDAYASKESLINEIRSLAFEKYWRPEIYDELLKDNWIKKGTKCPYKWQTMFYFTERSKDELILFLWKYYNGKFYRLSDFYKYHK